MTIEIKCLFPFQVCEMHESRFIKKDHNFSGCVSRIKANIATLQDQIWIFSPKHTRTLVPQHTGISSSRKEAKEHLNGMYRYNPCTIINRFIQICMAHGSLGKRIAVLTRPTKYWGPALIKHRQLVKHCPHFHVNPEEAIGMHSIERGLDNGAYTLHYEYTADTTLVDIQTSLYISCLTEKDKFQCFEKLMLNYNFIMIIIQRKLWHSYGETRYEDYAESWCVFVVFH